MIILCTNCTSFCRDFKLKKLFFRRTGFRSTLLSHFLQTLCSTSLFAVFFLNTSRGNIFEGRKLKFKELFDVS